MPAFKIVHKGAVRRLFLEQNGDQDDYQSLRDLVQDALGLGASFNLLYKDDEDDDVLVLSSAELRAATKQAGERTLRLVIQETDTADAATPGQSKTQELRGDDDDLSSMYDAANDGPSQQQPTSAGAPAATQEDAVPKTPLQLVAEALSSAGTVQGIQGALNSPALRDAVVAVAAAVASPGGGQGAAAAAGLAHLPALASVVEKLLQEHPALRAAVPRVAQGLMEAQAAQWIAQLGQVGSEGCVGGRRFRGHGHCGRGGRGRGRCVPPEHHQHHQHHQHHHPHHHAHFAEGEGTDGEGGEGGDVKVDQEAPQGAPHDADGQPRTRHPGVVCDGCSSNDALRAASAARGLVGGRGFLRGRRFKSRHAAHPDFDLCSACYETGFFTDSHGPFEEIQPRQRGCRGSGRATPRGVPAWKAALHEAVAEGAEIFAEAMPGQEAADLVRALTASLADAHQGRCRGGGKAQQGKSESKGGGGEGGGEGGKPEEEEEDGYVHFFGHQGAAATEGSAPPPPAEQQQQQQQQQQQVQVAEA
jgi:hypothetical protein